MVTKNSLLRSSQSGRRGIQSGRWNIYLKITKNDIFTKLIFHPLLPAMLNKLGKVRFLPASRQGCPEFVNGACDVNNAVRYFYF